VRFSGGLLDDLPFCQPFNCLKLGQLNFQGPGKPGLKYRKITELFIAGLYCK
jgi:hypothetical protein